MASIDIDALHPKGVMEELLLMRSNDMQRYLDPSTGRVREDFCVYTKCYVCGNDDTDTAFLKEGFTFVRCKRCHLVYVNPRLNDQKIREVYDSATYRYMFENLYIKSASYRKERLFAERMNFIEKYRPGGRLLDIGCGAGHFLQVAVERGWDGYGVELSKFGAEYAVQRLGLVVYNCSLEEADFPDGFSDVVTAWDVLEHTVDPVGLLEEIHRMLKSDGMVFIYVPNFDSAEVMLLGERTRAIEGDKHLIYFTPETLRKAVAKAGFEVVHWETQGLDIENLIWNLKNLGTDNRYDTRFLEDRKDALQALVNEARKGNNLRMYARRA